jgi:hypothetical protein
MKTWIRRTLIGLVLASPISVTSASISVADPGRNYILLSDNYGGHQYIGLPLVGKATPDEPISALPARLMTGDQVSNIFVQLCLTKLFDRSSYDAARADAAKDFVSADISLAEFTAPNPLIGTYTRAATRLVQEHSEYGIASLWLGDGVEALKGRQYIGYSGRLVITGPVSAKDMYSPQCNLTVNVSGLGSSKALLDGIQNSATGFAVIKRVEKPKYGYATWIKHGEDGRNVRITADSGYLLKPTQIVHLTVQLLPAGKYK